MVALGGALWRGASRRCLRNSFAKKWQSFGAVEGGLDSDEFFVIASDLPRSRQICRDRAAPCRGRELLGPLEIYSRQHARRAVRGVLRPFLRAVELGVFVWVAR